MTKRALLLLGLALGLGGCGDAARISILRDLRIPSGAVQLAELTSLRKEDFPGTYNRLEFSRMKDHEQTLIAENNSRAGADESERTSLEGLQTVIRQLEERELKRRSEWDTFVESITPKDRIFRGTAPGIISPGPPESRFYAAVTEGRKPRYYWE